RTDLVEVYATVSDRDGRFVTDLGRDEFVVREEGQVQAVSTFAAGDQPVSLAIAVDRSWSMAGERLAAAQRAGRALLNDLSDQDRAMLVAIGSDVDVPVPITNDRLAVDTALQRLDPWGSTALFDAVVTAFDAIEPAPGRRALVLVSDGLERNSTRTADDVLSRARASDVLAYPVVLDRKVSPLLERLAATTGGRAQRVRKLGDLPGALRRIASELRHQYLLGYQPTWPPASGEYRRVTVEVRRPRHVVRARAGYLVR
ncbi:MAG TPA: VWA domain-containing protein, partial [Luteitalea sp.]|nr:VWA domain-containing protein [Luteitalea sp.]